MCIRCRQTDASGPLELCSACTVRTRIEVSSGLRRLASYLASWAAFEEWCRLRDGAVAAGAR